MHQRRVTIILWGRFVYSISIDRNVCCLLSGSFRVRVAKRGADQAFPIPADSKAAAHLRGLRSDSCKQASFVRKTHERYLDLRVSYSYYAE